MPSSASAAALGSVTAHVAAIVAQLGLLPVRDLDDQLAAVAGSEPAAPREPNEPMLIEPPMGSEGDDDDDDDDDSSDDNDDDDDDEKGVAEHAGEGGSGSSSTAAPPRATVLSVRPPTPFGLLLLGLKAFLKLALALLGFYLVVQKGLLPLLAEEAVMPIQEMRVGFCETANVEPCGGRLGAGPG